MSGPTRKKRKTEDSAYNYTDNNAPNNPTTAASEHEDVRPGGGTSTDQFVEGSIVRITLRNFLTYDYAVMTPGPNLNMLVGANGTGKSSIVCAICLGLAGKTTVMGRGDKVGLYVKRGCHKGSIKIELYKNGGNLVIGREIGVENNTSVWTLNGKHSSQKAVEEEVRALRIQVSNLCQFLPQEKVGEFAKMTKIELLEATEKSVGPPEMYLYHCELKNFRTKERDLENALKEKASFLERAKQRNERNKVDMNRYYEKKKHLALIQTLERKKVWLEYNVIRTELDDVKKERDEAKNKFSTMKQAQAPILKKVQNIEKQLKPLEAQLKAKSDSIKEATRKCKQKQDQLDRKHKEIDDIKQSLRLKQTEEEDRQKRLRNTRRLIDDLRAELANVADQPDLVPQIDAVNAELRTIQEERANIEGEKDGLKRRRADVTAEIKMLSKRLKDMNNMMSVKEEKLRGRHKDTHSGVQWLRQNKEMFAGNVHEPMMLVINVKDHRFAKYVETHIAFNDLRAFVFQRKDDMEKFNKEVRDRLNLKVNTISAPQESCSSRPPSQPLESLKRFGFFSYLREMFDAPDEVMSYLCQQYRVHDVPVGDNKTKTMIKRVIEEPNLKILYTVDERYQVKRSFYSNKISTSNSSIYPSQYLNITVDAEEKNNAEKQLKACEATIKEIDEEMKTFQQRASQLDHRDNELRTEKKRLSDLKGKKRQLEQKISTKEDSLKQMEQGGIDLQKAEAEINGKIAAVHTQKVAIASELVAQMKLRASQSMEKVYLALETVGLSAEKTKLEDDIRGSGAELRVLDQACSQLDQRKKVLTETLRAQMGKFREICNLTGGEDIINNVATSLNHLPNNVDEIDSMLNEERSRAECFTGLNENVVEEYNKSEQEIKNIEKDVGEKTIQLDVYRQNISQAKERWFNPLKQLVEIINEKFSDFFRSMQCVGEVDLHYENEEEYDKYGIRIRVKFHSSTQLHELTPHHQSGGERSVSTMLYLMALQELNRCPFRVVDEINQGMDPINERRVFDIVVRTACKQSTSQYFFITPKLLQNLQYGEEMVVLLVNNAPDILVSNEFDERAFIRRRLRFRAKPKA